MTDDKSDPWEMLRERMSRWPIRTPKIKSIQKMLRLLYTKEEATLLHVFDRPFTDPKTVEEIAKALDKPLEPLRVQLDDLAQRGLLMKTRSRKGFTRYHLLPMIPGLFESYFGGTMNPETREEVTKLLNKAYKEGLGMELGASDYPWTRILPIEKTLSVDQQLETTPEILPFEKASEFIKTSWKIAQIRCACRVKIPCKHPVNNCICFDNFAAYMIERGLGKELSIEEAMSLLEECEKEGLMHTTINCQTRPQFICNCCSCSCNILRGLTELHNPRAFAKSNFLIQRDDAACNLCGRCVKLCPFGANQHHATHDKEPACMMTNNERCVGCGLCTYHCPKNALKLVKVRSEVPAATLVEAYQKVEENRVH